MKGREGVRSTLPDVQSLLSSLEKERRITLFNLSKVKSLILKKLDCLQLGTGLKKQRGAFVQCPRRLLKQFFQSFPHE